MAKDKNKDPNAPKKPFTPYFLFLMENRARITKAVGTKEALKAAGNEWRALPNQQKEMWNQRAEEDKNRYERELAEYNANKEHGIN